MCAGDLSGYIFCENGNSLYSDYYCNADYGKENNRGNASHGAGGVDYDI